MPVKNGLDVMKEARDAGALPTTVVLSGHDEFEYARKALKYGAVDYLPKPCAAPEIVSAIKRAAGAASQEAVSCGNVFVDKALEYMNERYPEDLTLTAVARHIGITPSYLSTLFKRAPGCGFTERLNAIRVERACGHFADSLAKTYEVAYKVGFRDERYFSGVFKRIKGVSPSEYRKGGC